MIMKLVVFLLGFSALLAAGTVTESDTGVDDVQPLKLALLKYSGGGDWYANPTALTNPSEANTDPPCTHTEANSSHKPNMS